MSYVQLTSIPADRDLTSLWA